MALKIFAVIVGLLVFIPGIILLVEHIALLRLYRSLYKDKTPQNILFNKYICGEITFTELIEENNKLIENDKKILQNKIRKQKLNKLKRKWF